MGHDVVQHPAALVRLHWPAVAGRGGGTNQFIAIPSVGDCVDEECCDMMSARGEMVVRSEVCEAGKMLIEAGGGGGGEW